MSNFIDTRSFLASNIDTMLEIMSAKRSESKIGADDLFSSFQEDISPTIPLKSTYNTLSSFSILTKEKESLGLYVSGNPLEMFRPIQSLAREYIFNDDLFIILINKSRKIFTKSNNIMFALSVSSIEEELECIVFPKIAPLYSPIIEEKELYWVRGKIGKRKKTKPELVEKPVINETGEEVEEHPREEEIREYDELPKLLVDKMSRFNDGFADLYVEDMSVSEVRLSFLRTLPWSDLKKSPELLSQILKPKNNSHQGKENQASGQKMSYSTKVQQNDVTDKSTRILTITRKMGLEALNIVKQNICKSEKDNCIQLELWIETSDNQTNKVKGPLWIPVEIFEKVSRLNQ